jgi:hypothetical protein
LSQRRYHWYLACIHFLDAGETDMAGRYLDAFMTDWSPSDSPEHALGKAYFYARQLRNADAAERAKSCAMSTTAA